jgi:C1A family cysteine protease
MSQIPKFVPIRPKIYRSSAPPPRKLRLAGPLSKNASDYKKYESFSWHIPSDIKQKRLLNTDSATQQKLGDLADKLLSPVLNQKNCGSCWAFATATCFADRHAIKDQRAHESLSMTDLISCANAAFDSDIKNSSGCDGGLPSEAGLYLETFGITQLACQPYNWCCEGADSGQEFTGNPPKCRYRDEKNNPSQACAKPGVVAQLHKAIKGSTGGVGTTVDGRPTGTIDQIVDKIKQNIWENGPAVCAYMVYSDFQDDMDSTWAKSSSGEAVYVKKASANMAGGHAVSIVGWGLAKGVTDTINNKTVSYGDLPFWWVRNSWSPAWGVDGYFRMAMTNPDKGINVDCGMDIPTKINDGSGGTFYMGGVTTFLPMAGVHEECESSDPTCQPGYKPGPDPTPSPSPTPSSGCPKWWSDCALRIPFTNTEIPAKHWILMLVIAGLLGIGIYMMVRKSK